MYLRNREIEFEMDALLGLMAEMINAQSGQPMIEQPGWKSGVHALSLKLFKHICSARALLEPNAFSSDTLPAFGYIDHGSISVLTRSAIENYLVMHWLNGAGSEDARHFRHMVWEYAGWKKRSKLFANGSEAKASRKAASEEAARLLQLIKGSVYLEKYEGRKKDSILKGNWDVAWPELASEAGFHLTYFGSVYRHLSGYVHSDFISALQVSQAQEIQTQYDLASASLQSCMMVMGHFSSFYSGVFPKAGSVFQAYPRAHELAEKWHLRTEDMNFLYTEEEA